MHKWHSPVRFTRTSLTPPKLPLIQIYINTRQGSKGAKFDEVKTLLNAFNSRFIKEKSQPGIICVDNCCLWRDLLQNIFENILVKLNVFDGIQRVVSIISKK